MMDPFSVLFVCLAFSKIVITSSASCGPTSLVADLNYAQTLTSPNYPGYYPEPTTCKWTIKAPYNKLVQLTFTAFDTYGNPTCGLSTDDTLKIYDASFEYNMIGKYCGKYLPANVVSSGQNLLLVFESKRRYYTGKNGFILKYQAVNNPAEDYSNCSPFNSKRNNKDINKYATTTTTKYIKSPLYPNKYPSNIECVWQISSLSYSNKIKLTLKNVKIFNYKDDSSCSSGNDVLTVHDGSSTYSSKLKTICRSTYSSTTVTSSGSSMTIRFKSNLDNYFSGSTAGFQAEYIEIGDSSSTASTVGVMVGVVIGVIIVIGLIVCCVCVAKKRGNQGYVQRTPAVTTMQTTTTTAPQYPMQPQGSCPLPPGGNYPPPVQVSYPPQGQANYPPPGQASYPPPGQASYPPPGQASYPPPGQASYPPPGQASYPPPGQGSYPPATQGSGYPQDKAAGGYPPPLLGSPYPEPSDPPPQYPGPPAYPPQQNQPYNPQATAQLNPPYPST